MTTAAAAAAPTAARPLSPGVVAADTSGLAAIHGLLGGTGAVRWKTLADDTQLPGGWKKIAYCEMPPGAGIGRPLRCEGSERIYYVLAGRGSMTINDLEEIDVREGQAVICPLGSVHGIRVPANAAGPMTFFLAEVFPGHGSQRADAARVSLPGSLDWCAGYRGGGRDQETRVTAVDLARRLTGAGRRFSLIEMQPDETLTYRLHHCVSEVLFVVSGDAAITAAGVTQAGGAGTCVGTPLSASVSIRNLSNVQPLTFISAEASV